MSRLRHPSVRTHPYIDGWSREAMSDEDEQKYIDAREKRGLQVRFSKRPPRLIRIRPIEGRPE